MTELTKKISVIAVVIYIELKKVTEYLTERISSGK